MRISGAKNAALPSMPACLLTDQPLTLHNIPNIGDVQTFASLLMLYGVDIVRDGAVMTLQSKGVANQIVSHDIVCDIRATILMLAPLVARYGKAKVRLPGGCKISNKRGIDIDQHIKGLERMGAKISINGSYIIAEAPKGLVGTEFTFTEVTVGGTENLLMAATLAHGKTVLMNAAQEPEISDLAELLQAMGAKISGIGSNCLTIIGVSSLHGAEHQVMSDRIEAGTYAIAAAITGGSLILYPFDHRLLDRFFDLLVAAGVTVESLTDQGQQAVKITAPKFPARLQAVDLTTEPYPGFPTDLQQPFMALMCLALGSSTITETVFNDRLKHVPELKRMGANIHTEGNSAVVQGVKYLTGAPVNSTDLRASASLVLAGLAARGETMVNHVYHLDRGYETLVEKLHACGAQIERVKAT